MNTQLINAEPLPRSARLAILSYLSISAIVFVLLMVFGIVMRMAQGQWLNISPALFYQVMTAHGAGMIGISGLAASAVLWYFLRRHVELMASILWVNLALFLAGVLFVLGGIFLGGFGAAWTFLFPLPSHSMGAWSREAAAAFLLGMLLIGTGFLVFYLDVARAILKKYGNLARALGWPQLFGSSTDFPPAPVVAGTMVLIVNLAGIVAGAVVLVLMLVNLYYPDFDIDPLFVKNLIYFFGHVFINATIYQAVIAVYEILPEYTGRKWKVNKVFLGAWTASTIMVMAVYPHHLLMDFVMPTWMLIIGQILSYTSGFPILVVTAYGALMIVYRSKIQWDMASALLFLSMFGWSVGVIPAIIDATISVNNFMHNTMWVPGHFHMYLVTGLVAMLFGFMYYLNQTQARSSLIDRIAFWLYTLGGIGFALSFLVSGASSVPRRWAQHFPEWVSLAQFASVFAIALAVAAIVFTLRFVMRLPSAKTA